MRKIFAHFLKGLIFCVPFGITIWVVYKVFTIIDGWLNIPIPGIGFAATIIFITLVGYLTSTIFARSILSLMDRIFKQLPFVKLLYTSIKDLTGAFTGNKKFFDRPVLVSLWPESDAKVIGFITKDSLEFMNIKDRVAVYMPQSYNFAGNLIIVSKNQVTPIDKSGAEVMAFIVSAGVSGSSSEPAAKTDKK